jgi:hypothetical protein
MCVCRRPRIFVIVNSLSKLALCGVCLLFISCAASLQKAISDSDEKQVRKILSKGDEDVNAIDEWTVRLAEGERFDIITCPLMHAIYEGDKVIIDLLLEAGANPNGPDHPLATSTPLYAATFEEGLFRIYSGPYDREIMKSLLDHGASVNKAINGSKLFISGAGINDPTFRMLRRVGAYINIDGYFIEGATPIHAAALMGSEGALQMLMDNDANVKTTNALGWTPLHSALRGSLDLDVIKLLLGHGADIDATDDLGETALMEAAKRGYLDAVRLLVDEGADKSLVSSENKTALVYAREGGFQEIGELLSE